MEGKNLVNAGIREYLVSMVIFLIPRFMRVYSFLGSCFWEDNFLCLFDVKNYNPVCLRTAITEPVTKSVEDDEIVSEVGVATETVVTGGEAVANAVITDIESTVEKDNDEMAVNVESGLQNDDIREYGETVKCMDTSFDSVYEETKLLIDYYEKQKAEEFIEERAEQVIEIMKLFGINSSRITEYSADVLSVVFGFGDMEYFAGIKLFNNVRLIKEFRKSIIYLIRMWQELAKVLLM